MIGKNKKIKKKRAFTLIEMMVFIFIFSIASLTFYKLFSVGSKTMANQKLRQIALNLANQKMEAIHNLDYENIGTIGGLPPGEIPQDETFQISSRDFIVHTSIVAVDDPFDGISEGGGDSRPSDYKKIQIKVSWQDPNGTNKIELYSQIAPPGIESIYTGGILSIRIVDGSGSGVSGATVKIANNQVSPNVDVTLTTDSDGNLFLPQAVVSDQTYNIQVSKSGYYSVQTYAPYPISTVYPVDVDASVAQASINQKTIVMDKISSIEIKTITPLDEIVPNIDFELKGGRKIADTASQNPEPIWGYNESSLATSAEGSKTISDISAGPYFFNYKDSENNQNYLFVRMGSTTNLKNSFDVAANVQANVSAIVADKNRQSFLVTITDSVDGSAISEAQVRLKKVDGTYEVTLNSDKFGQAYFPDKSADLIEGDYELSIDAQGYQSISNKSVSINKLTLENISMNLN